MSHESRVLDGVQDELRPISGSPFSHSETRSTAPSGPHQLRRLSAFALCDGLYTQFSYTAIVYDRPVVRVATLVCLVVTVPLREGPAEFSCEAIGGVLGSISSEEENSAVELQNGPVELLSRRGAIGVLQNRVLNYPVSVYRRLVVGHLHYQTDHRAVFRVTERVIDLNSLTILTNGRGDTRPAAVDRDGR